MNGRPEGKYLRGELHFMAITALRAKEQGDMRWLQLCMTLLLRFGLSEAEMVERLRRLAACPETI